MGMEIYRVSRPSFRGGDPISDGLYALGAALERRAERREEEEWRERDWAMRVRNEERAIEAAERQKRAEQRTIEADRRAREKEERAEEALRAANEFRGPTLRARNQIFRRRTQGLIDDAAADEALTALYDQGEAAARAAGYSETAVSAVFDPMRADFAADRGAMESELRSRAGADRAQAAELRAEAGEIRAQAGEERSIEAHEAAKRRAEESERRAEAAERRAEASERRAQDGSGTREITRSS